MFQVRIHVMVRTGVGISGITGVESGSRRGVVHGELRGMVHRMAVDVSGMGRI